MQFFCQLRKMLYLYSKIVLSAALSFFCCFVNWAVFPCLHMTTLSIFPHSPWLAPLAGYSDLTFRLLCREYGARVACTEMVSAKGLVYKSPGTEDLLATIAKDSPLVVQLFGNEVPFMQKAMHILLEQGFRYFDLNMGCSVPKVNRTGCGSAMLKDIENSLKVAKCMIDMADKACVGFKMRLGWNAASPIWQELPLRLQDLGAGWITLHPRYAEQKFTGTAHWQSLASLEKMMDIPLLASGDLFTAEDGMRCLAESHVQGLMFARGAMQNPAIFAAFTSLYEGKKLDPSLDIHKPAPLLQLIRRHMELAQEYSTERVALLKMRTFVPRYVHYFPGVRVLRQCLASCQSFAALDELLESFLFASEKSES